jgi:hypothetical protein
LDVLKASQERIKNSLRDIFWDEFVVASDGGWLSLYFPFEEWYFDGE